MKIYSLLLLTITISGNELIAARKVPIKIPVKKEVPEKPKPEPTRVKEIATFNEYKKVRYNIHGPTIFVFNSTTCQACHHMRTCVDKISMRHPKANFYCVQADGDGFNKKTREEIGIKAYPTSLFIKPGEKEARSERGSMEEQELDGIVADLIGVKKEVKPTEPLDITESSEETVETTQKAVPKKVKPTVPPKETIETTHKAAA